MTGSMGRADLLPNEATQPKLPGATQLSHGQVEVDGLRLHYAGAGAGEPLVLLHGWPQHWWAWREVIGPLASQYRVICPDIRGLGWSEGAADYGLARLAADLVGLLDALGIERTWLVGHDWGAAVGYEACLSRPDRFNAFMPVGGLTPWSSEGAPLRLWMRPWHIPVLAALGSRRGLTRRIAANSLRAWRHQGAFSETESSVYLERVCTQLSADATRRYYRQVAVREIPRFVRHHSEMQLEVPTLHLNGEHDPLTIGVPASYGRYAPEMRLELVPDCGHFIAEEAPGQLLARIEHFFGHSTQRPPAR